MNNYQRLHEFGYEVWSIPLPKETAEALGEGGANRNLEP